MSGDNFFLDFLAGGVSGAVAKTMVAPVDRIKLIIQTQDINPEVLSGKTMRYNGISDTFRRLVSEQGFRSMWRGNYTNVLRYFPTQACNLAFKDQIKLLFPHYNPEEQFGRFFLTQLLSGGIAGSTALLLVYPLDFARTRLASDVGTRQRQFTGITNCLTRTVRQQGILAVYRGFGLSCAGIFVYRAAQFGLNDTISSFNPWVTDMGWKGFASLYLTAQVSVTTSAIFSYPFDTVRRRVQMESDKPPHERMYRGVGDAARKILANHGVSGLYRGFLINTIRTIGSSFVLVFYQEIHTYYDHFHEHSNAH